MQMSPVQSMIQKRRVMDVSSGVPLSASFHPADETFARETLRILHQADPMRGWDIELQDDAISIWCDLHPTYGCRVYRNQLNKGYSIIRLKGQELVARIKANAC